MIRYGVDIGIPCLGPLGQMRCWLSPMMRMAGPPGACIGIWQRRRDANEPIEWGKAGPQSYSTYPGWRWIRQPRKNTNCNDDFITGPVQDCQVHRRTVERMQGGGLSVWFFHFCSFHGRKRSAVSGLSGDWSSGRAYQWKDKFRTIEILGSRFHLTGDLDD